MLYRTAVRALGDLISPRALERMLADAARERHVALADLDLGQLEDVLKREVYRRLQLSVPAALAKRRVQEVIEALRRGPGDAAPPPGDTALLEGLDEQARRFSLYFDWPDTQRLRAVLNVARQEAQDGRDPQALLQEGAALIAALERRLSEELVRQGRDLAELKAAMTRLQAVGGSKVRRLENLVRQIDEAQTARTLLPAEVERALSLSLTLRKQVESSVVQHLPAEEGAAPTPFDVSLLPPEAQARVKELDREHELRQLSDLARDFAALLLLRPALETALLGLRARSEGGELLLGEIAEQRQALEAALLTLLLEQRQALSDCEARLRPLPDDSGGRQARQLFSVAQSTLQTGTLAGDELSQLSTLLGTLESRSTRAVSVAEAEQVLALQRESFELERAARELPGGLEAVAGPLALARTRLAQGLLADLGPLWHALERRTADLHQERAGLDARADRVMAEYDRCRYLAGETIQRLGRLSDLLRAQRRLGALSASARQDYLGALEQAEALMGEAQAEFEAAREVTASFGVEALAGLLDVFDTDALDLSGSSTALLNTENPDPPRAAEPPPPTRREQAIREAAPDPFGLSGLLHAPVAAPVPPGRVWHVVGGFVVQGELSPLAAPLAGHWESAQDCEADVLRIAWLCDQAAELHADCLMLRARGHNWAAQQRADGSVLLSCAPTDTQASALLSGWSAGALEAGVSGPEMGSSETGNSEVPERGWLHPELNPGLNSELGRELLEPSHLTGERAG